MQSSDVIRDLTNRLPSGIRQSMITLQFSVPTSCIYDIGLSVAWAGMLAFDALVFALTLYQALSKRLPHQGRRSILTVILYDGPSLPLPITHSCQADTARFLI